MLSKSRFQALLQLTRHKSSRAEAGLFLVDGWRWLAEALELPGNIESVLATPGAARTPEEAALLERARASAAEFCEVAPEQLARLTDSVQAPGVAALLRWRPPEWAEFLDRAARPSASLVLALDGVGDPGNAGTIIRTADWFGAAGVVCGPRTVEPTNPKVVRTSMGSLFHLPIVGVEPLADRLAELQARGFVLVGAALDGGEPAETFRWPARAVLAIGNEANGLAPETLARLDARVTISAHGRAESLNAAVAAAVLMSDWRRAAGAAGPI